MSRQILLMSTLGQMDLSMALLISVGFVYYIHYVLQMVQCYYLHCILIPGDHRSAEPVDCTDV